MAPAFLLLPRVSQSQFSGHMHFDLCVLHFSSNCKWATSCSYVVTETERWKDCWGETWGKQKTKRKLGNRDNKETDNLQVGSPADPAHLARALQLMLGAESGPVTKLNSEWRLTHWCSIRSWNRNMIIFIRYSYFSFDKFLIGSNNCISNR